MVMIHTNDFSDNSALWLNLMMYYRNGNIIIELELSVNKSSR
jgi:hypothetical protein